MHNLLMECVIEAEQEAPGESEEPDPPAGQAACPWSGDAMCDSLDKKDLTKLAHTVYMTHAFDIYP